MNNVFHNILGLLTHIKTRTDAQYISFSTTPYGMRIQADWDDNCHCVYGTGEQEIKSIDFDFIEYLINYFNDEHDKVKIKTK